jgi:hypothetical protein
LKQVLERERTDSIDN